MKAARSEGRNHLKLVETVDPAETFVDLQAGELREDIERLVEVLIEIMDLADGDPDAEEDNEDSDATDN